MAKQTSIHLPMYNFFEALRHKGAQLGMDEYFCLLEALSKGFGLEEPEALYKTCKLLWFNPGDSAIQFRELFLQYWEEEHRYFSDLLSKEKREASEHTEEDPSNLSEEGEEEKQASGTEDLEVQQQQTRRVFDIDAEDEKDLEEYPPIQESIFPDPIMQQSNAAPIFNLEQELGKRFRIPIDRSMLDGLLNSGNEEEVEEVLAQFRFLAQPFSSKTDPRKVSLSWRHLWEHKGDRITPRINIPATIDKMAREGGRVREVIYHQEGIFEAKLMILIDDSKSMVAFKEQAEQMVQIIAQEIDSSPECYYFSDLALDRYFRDRAHTEAIKITELKSKYLRQRIPVLIISDGGAARGNYSKENIIKTYQGVAQVRNFASQIAWLNPMPRSRWNSPRPSSAWYIDQQVISMYDFSNEEVQAAVNLLRGKSRAKSGAY